METEINIVEILKDKPQGTKLYSSACGKCKLEEVDDKSFKISFYNSKFGFMNGGEGHLDKNGNLYDDGECIVFPSKEMRDWSKFAWKKGDILVSNDGGTEVIFDKWYDETYTSFYCKHYLNSEDENKIVYYETFLCTTERYSLEDKDSVQTYIKTIEEKLGGKLNRETLEIEKTQPEFKDGDIVSLEIRYIDSEDVIVETYILHGDYHNGENLNFYAGYRDNITDKVIYNSFVRPDKTSVRKELLRYATKEEKQQLFDALEKEGKRWDSEKKQIVDLPKECEFQPFDKVLVRNYDTDGWFPGFFEKFDSTWNNPYHIMNLRSLTDFAFKQCIPYEGNEHLLGTTKDVEG